MAVRRPTAPGVPQTPALRRLHRMRAATSIIPAGTLTPAAMPAAEAIRAVTLAAISGVEISMPAMTEAATLGVVVILAGAISVAVEISVGAVGTSVVVVILAVAAIPRI
jgi:hypothetical protein